MLVHRLTTVDNPFDVFDEFDDWMKYDRNANHNSMELLSRVSSYSNELSDYDQVLATEQAIDDIIALDPELKFRKVSRELVDG